MPDSQHTDDLFRDLERQFRRAEGAHRRRRFLAVAGLPLGLLLVVVGLNINVLVSLAGYGLMFVCVFSLAESIRHKAAVRFRHLTQQARERQSRFGGSPFRRGE